MQAPYKADEENIKSHNPYTLCKFQSQLLKPEFFFHAHAAGTREPIRLVEAVLGCTCPANVMNQEIETQFQIMVEANIC